MKSGIGFVACAYLMLVAGPPSRADTFDEIRKRGSIRWGGDQEGGGPYIYSAPNDPQKLIGFEVELMQMLADRLGVRSEFHQCEWDNLPNLLGTAEIDVIVNGYELTKSRLARMAATVPYYVYELQLLTRKDDATWIGDIVAGPNRVVFIQVKGAAASTVRWVANVRTVEVRM